MSTYQTQTVPQGDQNFNTNAPAYSSASYSQQQPQQQLQQQPQEQSTVNHAQFLKQLAINGVVVALISIAYIVETRRSYQYCLPPRISLMGHAFFATILIGWAFLLYRSLGTGYSAFPDTQEQKSTNVLTSTTHINYPFYAFLQFSSFFCLFLSFLSRFGNSSECPYGVFADIVFYIHWALTTATLVYSLSLVWKHRD